MDIFYLKSESETKKMLSDFWNDDIEYLVKIRILLKAYPGYSIGKLESRGISKLWQALSLEKKKEIYNSQFKYQISQI
ncbi:hypothetical protein ES705_37681 [subsurface metagenome]